MTYLLCMTPPLGLARPPFGGYWFRWPKCNNVEMRKLLNNDVSETGRPPHEIKSFILSH